MNKTIYHRGWMNDEMRAYVAKSISKKRPIECAKCGAKEHLEFHHLKYEGATIADIEILCAKCHRNVKDVSKSGSGFRTIFKNGKRYCEVGIWSFEY